MDRKEAIEVLRKYSPKDAGLREALQTLIPELKESEGERIKRAIIATIHLYYGEPLEDEAKEMLAWLKKQGEHNTDSFIWHKVKPKEYVLEKTLICKKNGEIDLVEDTILSVTDAEYALPISSFGIPKSLEKKSEKQGEQKEYPNEVIDNAVSFLTYRNDGMPEKEARDIVNSIISVIKPEYWPRYANMQNPAWSEEDEANLQFAIDDFQFCVDNNQFPVVYNTEKHKEVLASLKSLKDRVQPQSKQEWSEEDEQYLLVCKNALAKYQTTDKWDAGIISHWLEDKFKLLKERYTWKPSDEQMKALRWVLNNVPYNKHKEEISGLLDQIKDL